MTPITPHSIKSLLSLFLFINKIINFRCQTLLWLQSSYFSAPRESCSHFSCHARDNILKLLFYFWFITALAECNIVLYRLGTLEAFSWDFVRSQATVEVRLAGWGTSFFSLIYDCFCFPGNGMMNLFSLFLMLSTSLCFLVSFWDDSPQLNIVVLLIQQ